MAVFALRVSLYFNNVMSLTAVFILETKTPLQRCSLSEFSSVFVFWTQVDVVDALQSHQVVEEDGAAVWQRAILRGERCAPLVFSGLILYDEKGNPLPLRNKSDDYKSNQQHRTTDSI